MKYPLVCYKSTIRCITAIYMVLLAFIDVGDCGHKKPFISPSWSVSPNGKWLFVTVLQMEDRQSVDDSDFESRLDDDRNYRFLLPLVEGENLRVLDQIGRSYLLGHEYPLSSWSRSGDVIIYSDRAVADGDRPENVIFAFNIRTNQTERVVFPVVHGPTPILQASPDGRSILMLTKRKHTNAERSEETSGADRALMLVSLPDGQATALIEEIETSAQPMCEIVDAAWGRNVSECFVVTRTGNVSPQATITTMSLLKISGLNPIDRSGANAPRRIASILNDVAITFYEDSTEIPEPYHNMSIDHVLSGTNRLIVSRGATGGVWTYDYDATGENFVRVGPIPTLTVVEGRYRESEDVFNYWVSSRGFILKYVKSGPDQKEGDLYVSAFGDENQWVKVYTGNVVGADMIDDDTVIVQTPDENQVTSQFYLIDTKQGARRAVIDNSMVESILDSLGTPNP